MIDRDNPEIRKLANRLPSSSDIEAGLSALARFALAWDVEVEGVLPGASNCIVAAGSAGGVQVVLRIPQCEEESISGFAAQIAFSGKGGVPVLRSDPTTGSTLMPRLIPGTMLHEAALDPASEVAACSSVIRQFPPAPAIGAIAIESWYEPFLRIESAEGIPDEILQEGQRLAKRLLATTQGTVLLHCDLHHYNLLRNGEDWVAIDPKGVIGDPALEPAAFLRNPIAWEATPKLLEVRVNTFARELGLSVARIRDWGIAQNLLSAWWCEPGDRSRTVRVVEALCSLKH